MSNAQRLAILEVGHREAEQALVDLRAGWDREDEATRAARQFVLQAHLRGAEDRDALRVRLGATSLFATSDEGEQPEDPPEPIHKPGDKSDAGK